MYSLFMIYLLLYPINNIFSQFTHIHYLFTHNIIITHAVIIDTSRHHTLSPLTEESRLRIFGSPDHPVFLDSFFSDGHSVYSHKNEFESCGFPRKRV